MANSSRKQELPLELVDIKPPVNLKISRLASYLLYGWVIIGVTALGIRVFLLAFSANMQTPFVSFIYRLSEDYLAPFKGIFSSRSLGETGYLDIAAIFAIFIYLIFVWAASALIQFVQNKIDNNDREQRRLLAFERSQESNKSATTKN